MCAGMHVCVHVLACVCACNAGGICGGGWIQSSVFDFVQQLDVYF